ncbi:MAG: hypothetical protein IJC06_00810 [Clostridia bacterium]|nr:hypothetical protein [Clostridia bacterium]
MQNSKTYDIINGTEPVKNKPGINPVSVPWQNNTSAFDTLGSADKILLASKTDDYKDKQYKEEHKTPNAETKALQETLNKNGYTDSNNKPLVVDGILGDKTKYAFEKYIQEDTPKAEVFELQKKLNELGITDSDQNPLVIDGKLGKKTDSAVYNAIAKYSNKKSNKTLDKVSDFLTWVSLIPGLDTLSNLAAIPVDLLRGDYISAGLSAAGMLPYVGEVVDAAKLARVADKSVDAAKVADTATDVGNTIVKIPKLPKTPTELIDCGWKETTSSAMASKTSSRTFTDKNTGLNIRFDKGTEGLGGYGGKDHYHILNPNSTGKHDYYLDINGNTVPKNSKKSHIIP